MFKYRRVIVSLIAGLLVAAMLFGIIVLAVNAETSSEIKKKIEGLKQQQEAVQAQKNDIQNQLDDKSGEINDLVLKKSMIDQEIKLTMDSIDITTQQIQEYNLLIAEKQNELDAAIRARDEMSLRYRARIRSMEENGKITYWSILFKASSFSDMLDRVDMINEIALADSQILEKMEAAAKQIEISRQELALEKVELEEAKEALVQEEATLEAKRADSDAVFAELWNDKEALEAAAEKYEEQQNYIAYKIGVEEKNYQAALAAEEEARRKAEEARRKAAEEAARRKAAEEAARKKAEQEAREAKAKEQAAMRSSTTSSSSSSGSSSGGSTTSAAVSARSGFMWPSYCRIITSYFGPRIHPITKKASNHNGIDIGASYGTAIWAANSGTVTAAGWNTGYGYYVTINHGNGFSTLYGHMSRFIVSAGDYVTRGQVIGYIGSTGWSTAPHLHFTVYYGGAAVNPLGYLP